MVRYRLAVVIPAYREAGSIGPIVQQSARYADVIVIDDCSPDDTFEVAQRAGAHVVRNITNLGYDGTLSRGFEEANRLGYTHVVTLDADGEHDPSLIREFSRLLNEERIPLVLGVRPRKQRFAEVVMGHYVRWRFGADDILCGMKGYDLAIWIQNGGFDHCNSVGTELAISALRRGVRFSQFPVYGTPRVDEPRFDRLWRANIRIFVALWRTIVRPLPESGLEHS